MVFYSYVFQQCGGSCSEEDHKIANRRFKAFFDDMVNRLVDSEIKAPICVDYGYCGENDILANYNKERREKKRAIWRLIRKANPGNAAAEAYVTFWENYRY